MRLLLLALSLVVILAYALPADALRPVNAGQEEFATARLTHALAAGLEEPTPQASPELEFSMGRAANRVANYLRSSEGGPRRDNPGWFSQLRAHAPVLESWGYGRFLQDYLHQASPEELLKSPVITWRFEERDMARWLKDQAFHVECLYQLARDGVIQPVWRVDGQERSPLEFAATVAFQEPHRLSAIVRACGQRDEHILEILKVRSTWNQWRTLLGRQPLPDAEKRVQLFVAAQRSLTPSRTIHRVVGWWQRLTDFPLEQIIPRETVAALAAHTLSTLQQDGIAPLEHNPNITCHNIAYQFLRESAKEGTPDDSLEAGLEAPWVLDDAAAEIDRSAIYA